MLAAEKNAAQIDGHSLFPALQAYVFNVFDRAGYRSIIYESVNAVFHRQGFLHHPDDLRFGSDVAMDKNGFAAELAGDGFRRLPAAFDVNVGNYHMSAILCQAQSDLLAYALTAAGDYCYHVIQSHNVLSFLLFAKKWGPRNSGTRQEISMIAYVPAFLRLSFDAGGNRMYRNGV
jgi:hypothetical protein